FSGRELQPTIAHPYEEDGTPEPMLCGCEPGHAERTGRLRVRVVERQILRCFSSHFRGNEWGAAGAHWSVKSGGHSHGLDCPALWAGGLIGGSFIGAGLESRPGHGCSLPSSRAGRPAVPRGTASLPRPSAT